MKSCLPFAFTDDGIRMCSVFSPCVTTDCSDSLIFDRVTKCPCSEDDFYRCLDYADICHIDTLKPRDVVFAWVFRSDLDRLSEV